MAPELPIIYPQTRRSWVTIDDPVRPHAHGSCLVRTRAGLACAWFAGSREGAPETVVMTSFSEGGEWSPPSSVPGPPGPTWNPVLDVDEHDALRVFFKIGPDPASWVTWVSRFADGWVPARPLLLDDRAAAGGRGPVRTHLLRRPGRVLAPGSDERARPWRAFVDIEARDEWERYDIPSSDPAVSMIQPSLVDHDSGVLAFLRTDSGRVFRSRSEEGRTWSAAAAVDLPNNNSGLDVVAIGGGRLAAVHNPSSDDWGIRCPLVVSVSADGGSSWEQRAVLEDGRTPIGAVPAGGFAGESEAFDGSLSGRHEYSYPSAVVRADELLVSYTWQRRGIALAALPLAALR